MDCIRYVAAIFIAVLLVISVTGGHYYDIPDYRDHPCLRSCLDNETPRVCKYHFIIENYLVLPKACYNCPFNQSDCFRPHCVPGSGVNRQLRVANRKLPGPSVEVCLGDTIEVRVDNRMQLGEGTAIHWHGQRQRGSQYMDGVSHFTQCDIGAYSTFTYRFKAADPGTHLWHSHSGVQRADGLFGALIVRSAPSLEPYFHHYDFDLPEHVIVITDWINDATMDSFTFRYHGYGSIQPHTILVNGLSSSHEFKDASGRSVFMPKATFTVTSGRKYRFRVISAGLIMCTIQVSVDGHNLTMIASDGNPFEPYEVEAFSINSAERYDFILSADYTGPLKNFWIRFRGLALCVPVNISETAILKYEGANDDLPPEATAWSDGTPKGKILNQWKVDESEDTVEISRMRCLEPDDDVLTSTPDRKLYLLLSSLYMDNPKYYDPILYPQSAPGMPQIRFGQISHITSMNPSSPLLSQYNDTPQSAYCNAETVTTDCEKNFCSCIHRYVFELGDIVEIVLIDDGLYSEDGHPMHLHGHTFRVLGLDKVNATTSLAEIMSMDAKGQLIRATTLAPIKDTVTVPGGGYAIIRFRADNPGIWLFHCHVEFHLEDGMNMVFQVGQENQLPSKPNNFPACGNWRPDD